MSSLLKRTLLITAGGLMSIGVFAQKEDVPKGWHLLDKADSGYYGISIDKAYQFIKSKNLKSTPVIVAVIDSGVDTLHEDLKSILWHNPKEIPGNGIDDDKNGYVDDIYGWNFLGNADGKNVEKDSYESARVYHQFKTKFDGKTIDPKSLSKEEQKEYELFLKAKKDVGTADPAQAMNIKLIKKAWGDAKNGDSLLKKSITKENYTGKDIEALTPADDAGKKARRNILNLYRGLQIELEQPVGEVLQEIQEYVDSEETKLNASEKAPEAYRANIVKDNYADFNDRFYGNNNVMVSKSAALHGTHVSGIIAAARNNGVGMNGVADNVRIMTVRAVPDGDEHDKDIALAIRYAADNGARVINMSFGKGLSPEKKWIDEAVKYAESKGVLLVHAAGNSAENLDSTANFPTPLFEDNKRAPNWITVGASGDPKAGGLTASFSNYGKKEVDIFAPGVKIYSTVPGGNTYQNLQGTSMASPVVAGLAAFIMEYYPKLSAEQVKFVIEKSSQNPGVKVKVPGTGEEADLSDISKYGGVINAYEAIKLASTLKPAVKQVQKPVKSKVKTKVKS